MKTKERYVLKSEILVPIFGGLWDGGDFLAKDLTPGKVYYLRESRYRMEWNKDKPRLVPDERAK